MHPVVNIMVDAARKAGREIAFAYDRRDLLVITEKSENNYVTNIDQRAERILMEVLSKAYPKFGFIAEESGEYEADLEHVWIIDPIDGTRNFMHGVPHFCISLAQRTKHRIEHAVVYDPMRDELFYASRGEGAFLNHKRLRVTQQHKLQNALLATGFPLRHDPVACNKYLSLLKIFMPACGDLRRTGSAALDLAYVAAGRFDGFFERDLSVWDIAGGCLLVKEAGGMVSDFSGDEHYLASGNIIATNPKLFKTLLQTIVSTIPSGQ